MLRLRVSERIACVCICAPLCAMCMCVSESMLSLKLFYCIFCAVSCHCNTYVSYSARSEHTIHKQWSPKRADDYFSPILLQDFFCSNHSHLLPSSEPYFLSYDTADFTFEIALFRHNAWNSWFNRELHICSRSAATAAIVAVVAAVFNVIFSLLMMPCHAFPPFAVTQFSRTVNFHLQKSASGLYFSTLFPMWFCLSEAWRGSKC